MEENQTNETELGTTQEDVETVDINDATDEELADFIKNDGEPQEAEEEEKESTEEDTKEPDTEQQEETKEDEAADKEDQTDSKPPKETSEDYEKLKKQVEQQEAFIQKQKGEIGKARQEKEEAKKAYEQQNAQIQAAIDNGDLEPDKIVDLKLKKQDNQRKIESAGEEVAELDLQEQAIAQRENNKAFLESKVNPEQFNMKTMVETLQRDGASTEELQAFVQDPYNFDAAFTLQLHKRSQAEAAVIKIGAMYKALREENEALKNKPNETLRNLEKVTNKPSSVTNTNGGGGAVKGRTIDEADISNLSDDELAEMVAGAAS